ncbi:tyrosine-type recombinase/integrase [Nonomuraea sp. NPDC050556]|uniref:tyrosine-type recombinase/integrase n=1 Tax=Nonomuraea sp. NPDC050556 TaxID=3364369 RepID=UPI00379C9AB3
MASIEKRPGKGKKISYRVRWRLGGSADGAWQSETFDQKASAVTFKLAVEACGHYWPDNWVKGFGWAPEGPAEAEPDPPVPFGQYAQRLVASLSGIEDRTRSDYLRDLKNHILPVFGELDLRDESQVFDRVTVSTWVNQLHRGIPDPVEPRQWLRRPLAPKTIQNLHGLLYTILQSAVEAIPPIRSSNPAARTRLPRLDDGEGDDEMVFLTEQDFSLLRSCAKADVRDMLTVFVGTGLRYAELAALQVRDIEPFAKPVPTLRVRRAWKRQADNTFKLGPPKTKQSRRTIALSPMVLDAILPHIAGKYPEEFVFKSPTGSWWRHSSFYDRRWIPAVDDAISRGLTKRPRIHDLRHTHVAWLISDNIPMAAIQRRMGHKSITTTIDRYGHLLPYVDQDLIESIDRALGGGLRAVRSVA